MPGFAFYALGSDFDPVLDYIFEKSGVRVFESYSDFDAEIVEFKSSSEIKNAPGFGRPRGSGPSLMLELVVPSAFETYWIRKITLTPNEGGHKFRYALSGWGLIQLQIGGAGPDGLKPTHTNHNTETRARNWRPTYPEGDSPEDWDWREVTTVSSALNRYIGKLAVRKFESNNRPVLPEAQAAFEAGMAFKPS